MSIYYLMIKTHKITGLKYLCQTKKSDPILYKGSGTLWKKHLEIFGDNISTDIIFETTEWEHLKEAGRFYSTLYNIVGAMDDFGNKIWANLIPETGGGSGLHNKGKKRTPEQCKRIKANTPLRKGLDHHSYDSTVYKWVKQDTGEVMFATRQEFIGKTKASAGNIVGHLRGERKFVSGWVNESAIPYRGERSSGMPGALHSKYDHTIYEWVNDRLSLCESMTRFDLIKKYNLSSGSICELLQSKRKSVNGWRVLG